MQVLTDISEAKRLQQQFLQAQKMEAFGQLAGGVAHDFNNLLTVILGFSELSRGTPPGPAGRPRRSRRNHEGGRPGSQLTRQLLAFSRQAGMVASGPGPQPGDRDFEKMLSRSWRGHQPRDCPAVNCEHIKADPGQIEQAGHESGRQLARRHARGGR